MSVLRKTSAILKTSVLFLPIVTGLVGIGVLIGAKSVGTSSKKSYMEEVANNTIVQEYKQQDLEIYTQRFENGEITMTEFSDRKQYLESEDFLEDALEMPELAYQKGIIKQTEEKYNKMALTSGIISIAGFVISIGEIILLKTSAFDKYLDSIETDWFYKANPNKKKKEEDILEIKY